MWNNVKYRYTYMCVCVSRICAFISIFNILFVNNNNYVNNISFRNACYLCCIKQSVLSALDVLDTVVCYAIFPQETLRYFICTLCRTVNDEAYCSTSWKVRISCLYNCIQIRICCTLLKESFIWANDQKTKYNDSDFTSRFGAKTLVVASKCYISHIYTERRLLYFFFNSFSNEPFLNAVGVTVNLKFSALFKTKFNFSFFLHKSGFDKTHVKHGIYNGLEIYENSHAAFMFYYVFDDITLFATAIR